MVHRSTATIGDKVLAYLAFNGVLLLVIGLNLFLLIGLIRFPFQLGAYFFLPYYSYAKILSRQELRQGGRWTTFSKSFFLFKIIRNHLGINFHRPLPKGLTSAINDPQNRHEQYMFAIFPHGTADDFRVAMDGMLDEVFPDRIYKKIRTLGASVLFLIPIVREICLWTSVIDASRPVAESALDKGYSLLLFPGGLSEQIQTIYQKERIYLKNRKGFLKLAMRKGVPVVPVYAFGVSDYYRTSRFGLGPRLWLVKALGICIPFAVGLWGSILCPLPAKTTIVFGEPLKFSLKDPGNPTCEELDKAHDSFSNALIRLFDSHKGALGYGDRTLEVL